MRDLTGADQIVMAVRRIIDHLAPKAWFIDNPHSLLHSRPIMKDVAHMRATCTYCQYGAEYKKETDIWTNVQVSLRHCNDTPCAHFRAYGSHARTAQAGPSGMRSGAPGTPREEAYRVPQPLMRQLMKAALQAYGYDVLEEEDVTWCFEETGNAERITERMLTTHQSESVGGRLFVYEQIERCKIDFV